MEEAKKLVADLEIVDGEFYFKKAELLLNIERYHEAIKYYKKSYKIFKGVYSVSIALLGIKEDDISEIKRIKDRVRELSEAGNAEAILLRTKMEKKDLSKEERLKLCEKAAKINYAEALFNLARIYLDIESKDRSLINIKKGENLLRKAAVLGNADAKYYLDLVVNKYWGEAGSFEVMQKYLNHEIDPFSEE